MALTPTRAQDERIERLLEQGEAALEVGDGERVRAIVREMRALGGADEGRAYYLEALLAWDQDGSAAAVPGLERAVAAEPDDADIRHALGLALEEQGDHEGMRRQWLLTRQLDAAGDRRGGVGTRAELDFIAETARDAIERLPDEIRERLRNVAVVLEPRPSIALVREGFDPRAFGLFDAPPLGDDSLAAEGPSRIVLYSSNLLASFRDLDELAEGVAVTVLHEIAHYFGFEEEEMERLGLE